MKKHFQVFILFSSSIFAQNNVYTLKYCVETAITNNIDLKQAELTQHLANVSQTQAINQRYPTINANARTGYQFGRSIDPRTNEFKEQRIDNTNFSINASIVLFNFNRINNTIQQQKKNGISAEEEKNDIKNRLYLNLVQTYFQILFQKEILLTAQNQILTTQSDIDRTQKLVNAGTVVELNLLNLKSKLNTDELAVVNAENQLIISKLNLIQLMNIPTDDLDLKTIDFETFNLVLDSTNSTYSSTEIYKQAFANQPVIKASKYRLDEAAFAIKASESTKYPTLSLFANSQTFFTSTYKKPNITTLMLDDVPFANQFYQNLNNGLFLNLDVPILNGYRARANVQNSKINFERQKLNFESKSNQLRKQIEQANVDTKAAESRFKAIKNQIKSSEEALRATEKRFNAGLANAVELITAQNTIFKSKSDLVQAKYDLFLKKKVLDFYLTNEFTF